MVAEKSIAIIINAIPNRAFIKRTGRVTSAVAVTVTVNTVPNANWHDAMFTQFAARQTDFDIAVLDSQHIGEAVTNGNILDITDFINENIETDAYDPYLLAAYGQYPQAETGQRDESASMYGLPLLGDTWTMIYRKDLIGDEPPETWDEMIEVAAQCQEDNPGVYGLAFHQANGSDAAAVTYNTVNALYGGNLWVQADGQIEGIINDDAGHSRDGTCVQVSEGRVEVLSASGRRFLTAGQQWGCDADRGQDPALTDDALGSTEDAHELVRSAIGFDIKLE